MGLFGRGKDKNKEVEAEGAASKQAEAQATAAAAAPQESAAPANKPELAMSGEANVFKFGSARISITLAGCCLVSDELEPRRWEVLPTGGAEAPKFRIIF